MCIQLCAVDVCWLLLGKSTRSSVLSPRFSLSAGISSIQSNNTDTKFIYTLKYAYVQRYKVVDMNTQKCK